jgi:hypothetical protein
MKEEKADKRGKPEETSGFQSEQCGQYLFLSFWGKRVLCIFML